MSSLGELRGRKEWANSPIPFERKFDFPGPGALGGSIFFGRHHRLTC
jgi:hypothetical protein